MADNLDQSASFAAHADEVYNPAGGTVTLFAGNYGTSAPDADATTPVQRIGDIFRTILSGDWWYLKETQTSPDNPTMVHTFGGWPFRLGFRYRPLLLVRVVSGSGNAGIFQGGSQVGSTVTFSGAAWHLIDLGQHVMRDFEETWDIRVWGGEIHVGTLWGMSRALGFVDAASVGGDATASRADSIAGTVAVFDQDHNSGGTGDTIFTTPFSDIDISQRVIPYLVGWVEGGFAGGGANDDITIPEPAIAAYRNTDFLQNGTAGVHTPGTTAGFWRSTPAVGQITRTNTVWPPSVGAGTNDAGYVFADTDDLVVTCGEDFTTGGDGRQMIVDLIAAVRRRPDVFFDAYNTGNAASFAYSWTPDDPDGILDHYRLVVTEMGTEPDDPGPIVIDVDPVTSPHTLTLDPGAYRVYICPVTGDGDFKDYDYDEVVITGAGQIIRYR